MLVPEHGKKDGSMRPDLSRRAMGWIGSVPSLIGHTIFFVVSFSLVFFGVDLDKILLVVTTLVSLEAIYLAIFIQMAVNQNTQSLDEVEKDIDEIQEDVEEIQEDVEEIQEDDLEAVPGEMPEEAIADGKRLVLAKLETQLEDLLAEIAKLKNNLE